MALKKKQKGSVIIEVLIAALIFGVAIFALIEFQTTLLQNRTLLGQQTDAMDGAEDKMDQFRSYTALTATGGQFAYSDITNGSSTNVGLTATYTTNWYVTDYPATGGATTDATDFNVRKAVRVVVTWTDSAGVAHTSTNAGATDSAVYIDGVINQIDPAGGGKVSEP
jgi:Tfp pilus assembly protein PilV